MRKLGIFAAAVVVVSLVVVPLIAHADNAGLSDFDSQRVVYVDEGASSDEFESERLADAAAIATLVETGNRTRLVQAVQRYAQKHDRGKLLETIRVQSSSACLYVTTIGQQTTYYCGPASAEQLLRYLGVTSHPVDGRVLSQANLASDLGTHAEGTNWTGTWRTTLRSWSQELYYTVSNPSQTLV